MGSKVSFRQWATGSAVVGIVGVLAWLAVQRSTLPPPTATASATASASASASESPSAATSTAPGSSLAKPAPTPTAYPIAAGRVRPTLTFEPNAGQALADVRYVARASQASAEVLDDGVRFRSVAASGAPGTTTLRFVGTRGAAAFDAREPAPGVTHHLTGERAHWRRNVTSYGQLRRTDVYPGIDLVWYGRASALEYDLVVKPGADPSRIRFAVEGEGEGKGEGKGVRPATLDAATGDLLLDGATGHLRLHAPQVYQVVDGERRPVDGRYVRHADGRYGFAVGSYDTSRPLVIDPVIKLLYGTYLGGVHDDQVAGMAVDAEGNAYVVGFSGSEDWPVTGNAWQSTRKALGRYVRNVVVTKFDPSGTLVYSTFIGGSTNDYGKSIAVDASGRAYIAGTTNSPDYPVTANAYQSAYRGTQSAFLSVLSSDGSTLAYSTFYGGSGGANVANLALDGGAVVVGGTAGPGLPTTAGAYKTTLATGIAPYVARFDLTQSGSAQLQAATYYGTDAPQANFSTAGAIEHGLAIDAAGTHWIVGQAFTTNLPLAGTALRPSPTAMSPSCSAGSVPLNSFAYVARLSADLKSLVYASYLSGRNGGPNTCAEYAYAIAFDAAGRVLVGGTTSSLAFPVTAGAAQSAWPGAGSGFDGYASFVTAFDPQAGTIAWSTYLGGQNGRTYMSGLAIDAAGAPWVALSSAGGSNFPVSPDALQRSHGGGAFDGAYVKLDGSTGGLLHGSYFGGSGDDGLIGFSVDRYGTLRLAGHTTSRNHPVTANAVQPAYTADAYDGNDWTFAIIGTGTISRVWPQTLGTGADTTLALTGAGFVDGATCRLDGAASIASTSTSVAADGSSMGCSFTPPAGSATGAYDVTVTNPDGTSFTARAAVQLAEIGDGDVDVAVLGRSAIRVGVPAVFPVTLTNQASVDAYDVPLFIHFPAALGPADNTPGNGYGLPLIDPANIPWGTSGSEATLPIARDSADGDGSKVIQLVVPYLAAGQSITFPFTAKASAESDDLWVEAWALGPYGDTLASLGVTYAKPGGTSGRRSKPMSDECKKALWDLAVKKALDKLKDKILDPNAPLKALDALNQLYEQAAITGHALGHNPAVRTPYGAAVAAEQMFPKFVSAYGATAEALGIKVGTLAAVLAELAKIMETSDDIGELSDKCKDKDHPDKNPAKAKPKGKAKKKSKGQGAIDPNDISGPNGDGSDVHWLNARAAFDYQIDFENLPTASLPAADVVVTTSVDPTRFDLATLALGDIVVGTRTIAVPPGLRSYATTLPVSPALEVRLQGSLDPASGTLKWTFTSLDPATGLPPSDPTLGFLPPDVDGLSGRGAVRFSVKPKNGLAENSAWTQQASIVFDANAAIVTPVWTNTLDTTAPTSQVTAATAASGRADVAVTWAGRDSGSGVRQYDVYVSDDGGPFALWQAATRVTGATYTGIAGHRYGFYAIATDGAGNTEAAKGAAEATATAGAGGGGSTDDGGSGGSGGGGCTIGDDGRRDVSLPLLLLFALAVIGWRRHRRAMRRVQRSSSEAA